MEKQITEIKSKDVLSGLFGIDSEINEAAEEISGVINEFNKENPNYSLKLIDFIDFNFDVIDSDVDCIYTTFFTVLVPVIIGKIDSNINLFELPDVYVNYNMGNADIDLTDLLDDLDSSVLGELIKALSKLTCISIFI